MALRQPTSPLPPCRRQPPPPPRRRVGLLSYVLVALAAGALGAGSVVALYHPASPASAAAPAPSSSATRRFPRSPHPTRQQRAAGARAEQRCRPAPPCSRGGEQGLAWPGHHQHHAAVQQRAGRGYRHGDQPQRPGADQQPRHRELHHDHRDGAATGNMYQAKVLGYDVTGDIAQIQLQGASGLQTIPIGNSSTVKAGDSVVAHGQRRGAERHRPAARARSPALNQTITAADQGGTVTPETLHGMIKTNATSSPATPAARWPTPRARSSAWTPRATTAASRPAVDAAGLRHPDRHRAGGRQPDRAGQASSTITIGYPPFMGIYIGQGSTSSSPQDPGRSSSNSRTVRRLRRRQRFRQRRHRQPGLLHQRPQPGRPGHHRQRQLGHAGPRHDLRRSRPRPRA